MALEDLARYESAAVAAMNVKKEPQLATIAMGDFYRNILQEEDPIINKSLQEASSGGEAGITNLGVVQAIELYGKGKYEEAFATTKISNLTDYLTQGYDILHSKQLLPNEAKEALAKYNENTFVDLMKKLEDKNTSDEDKKSIEKIVQTISILKNRKLRAKTLDIINYNTTMALDALYKTPKNNSTE